MILQTYAGRAAMTPHPTQVRRGMTIQAKKKPSQYKLLNTAAMAALSYLTYFPFPLSIS